MKNMKRTISGLIVSIVILTNFITMGNFVFAANLENAFTSDGPLGQVGDKAGYNIQQRTLDPLISQIITIVLSFLGVIFLVLMIYGGFLWMTSAGNEDRTKKAKAIFISALIGLIIVVVAYAITFFVLDQIVEGSGLLKK